jgi:hypothetical protein
MQTRLAAIMVSTVMSLSYGAAAHDVSGNMPGKWDSQRTYMPIDRAASSVRPPGADRAPAFVVVLPNRWAVGQDLHICFNGGNPVLRAKILAVAQEWLKYANLKFVTGAPTGQPCGDHDKSEIRIGFSEPGYWSYIGNDSLSSDLLDKGLSSMNFQGFDTSPIVEPRFTGVILHEFGHALGFHHEHQSPGEGCDKEYDWDKLYAFYMQAYGWDKTMVDQNVRQLQADRRAYDWSAPDPQSIMVYASDPQFLIKGTQSSCYFNENDKLSSLDIVGAQTTYPSSNTKPHLSGMASDLESILRSMPESMTDLRNGVVRQLSLTKEQLQKLP